MLNTYDQAKRFYHKQLGQYLILQDAFSIHAFLITSFNGMEPDKLDHIKSIDKANYPEVKTYDNAYDLLVGEPSSMPNFAKTVSL